MPLTASGSGGGSQEAGQETGEGLYHSQHYLNRGHIDHTNNPWRITTIGILFIWFALSIVAGVIAGSKNRNWFGYLALSLILSPIVGIILAAALPAIPKTVEEAATD